MQLFLHVHKSLPGGFSNVDSFFVNVFKERNAHEAGGVMRLPFFSIRNIFAVVARHAHSVKKRNLSPGLEAAKAVLLKYFTILFD